MRSVVAPGTRADATSAREGILAIVEAKWNEVIGAGHLTRLTHMRALLTTSTDPGIQLIDLERLYGP